MNQTSPVFPSTEWMQIFSDKLNTDQQYAHIAKNWEGDLRIVMTPDGSLTEVVWLYFDLWHGKCRGAYIEDQSSTTKPALVLRAPYTNFVKILSGNVGVMQALMTRMITVKGKMALIMRNVPTVLDFVRCAQEVTKNWI